MLRVISSLFWGGWLGCFAAAAGQLPPEIVADKLLYQAEQLVGDQDYVGAREAMEKLLSLQQEHGLEPLPEDHFRHAQVWFLASDPERAREALVRYLQLRGREAEHYDKALQLMNRAEALIEERGLERQRLIRQRQANERWQRRAREALETMEFVMIPAGQFRMGSKCKKNKDCFDERPIHQVKIGEPFDLGKYEVTLEQWNAVMIGNERFDYHRTPQGCERCPVNGVSLESVREFLRVANGLGTARYRLPTEAEWEYAARAGTTGDRYSYDLNAIAWYRDNSGGRVHPVGGKAPNGYGLHDMLGNVWEWVQDRYGPYPGFVAKSNWEKFQLWRGNNSKTDVVMRGCDCDSPAESCRSSIRVGFPPTGSSSADRGFRLVRIEP